MSTEVFHRLNAALQELVGLQVQVITFAYPIDFTISPAPDSNLPSCFLRIESPFEISGNDWTELITPGRYGANVLVVVELLWEYVASASVDLESRLHVTFASGKRLNVLAAEHLDWEMGDWHVCGEL